MTEEITKLESDRKFQEKHQLETSVMQVQAEDNQWKTENNELRNQIAAERIQLESHHKEDKLHLEFCHQREKQILLSEVERLTKELERITTVSSKKSLVSILHSYKECLLIFYQEYWLL